MPGFGSRNDYDIIELYAGRARIARMAKAAGFQAVATDKNYDTSGNCRSALQLNENSGFALLGLASCSSSLNSPWIINR